MNWKYINKLKLIIKYFSLWGYLLIFEMRWKSKKIVVFYNTIRQGITHLFYFTDYIVFFLWRSWFSRSEDECNDLSIYLQFDHNSLSAGDTNENRRISI